LSTLFTTKSTIFKFDEYQIKQIFSLFSKSVFGEHLFKLKKIPKVFIKIPAITVDRYFYA